ncbi:hypothetical protein OsI_29934 [Oryza sativa Indica Group]|uniref:Uncharacterized protein n=2 Tax=Oryza TaxID=4527 RepID=A0A0E0QLD7_ORYRU|nr:hypothetical protein OsI_29934 [Oryza sativa Indica Group]
MAANFFCFFAGLCIGISIQANDEEQQRRRRLVELERRGEEREKQVAEMVSREEDRERERKKNLDKLDQIVQILRNL